MADKPLRPGMTLAPFVLICDCGAMNIPGAKETIELQNGRLICNCCGHTAEWPPLRPEGT